MTFKNFKYTPFKFKLKLPFKNSQFTITHRKGYYLEVTGKNGGVVIGEASPLDGFSRESIKDVETQLILFDKYLEAVNYKVDIDNYITWANENGIVASLKFAIEQILFAQILSKNRNTVTINQLIGINKTFDETKFNSTTVKIKVGYNFEDEFSFIKKVRKENPNIKIRLDANSSWSFSEAEKNISILKPLGIEYIEDPTRCLSECKKLNNLNSIPVALDQVLLSENSVETVISNSDIKFLVIKPMCWGIKKTIDIIRLSKAYNRKVIISSLFESAIGRKAVFYLANLSDANCHGLIPSGYLVDEHYNDNLTFNNWKLYWE